MSALPAGPGVSVPLAVSVLSALSCAGTTSEAGTSDEDDASEEGCGNDAAGAAVSIGLAACAALAAKVSATAIHIGVIIRSANESARSSIAEEKCFVILLKTKTNIVASRRHAA